MDKFGIFKLLNSFLDLYSKNTNQNTDNLSATIKNESSQNTNSHFNIQDLLSSLFKGSNDNAKSEPTFKPNAKPQNPSTEKTTPPLREKMLLTLSSHDEFVKKVKNNARATSPQKPL